MNTKEFAFKGVRLNGFLALFLLLIVLPLVTFFLLLFMVQSIPSFFIISILAALVFILGLCGLFSQEPNEARVMVLFGKYKGTFTNTGFFWVNPFLSRKKLSLRARNLNADPIKVNDKIGNPIMIGLVLVWKLKDTYKAMFEIDAQTMAAKADQIATVASRMRAFESFVRVQSDAALRQVAGEYAYDEMIERGIIATRQLAKRQFTWLRSWDDVEWLDSLSCNKMSQVLKRLERLSI